LNNAQIINLQKPEALSIVSYIGCGISIICLLIAVCLFIALRYVCLLLISISSIYTSCMFSLRKKVFFQKQHFLHLNLSIALLLGLIIFVSGIETASEYRVSVQYKASNITFIIYILKTSCLIVAILLHYFFMAAFSWMLCEGILMFILIKFVFYHGFLKSKVYFLLLGWGEFY